MHFYVDNKFDLDLFSSDEKMQHIYTLVRLFPILSQRFLVLISQAQLSLDPQLDEEHDLSPILYILPHRQYPT